MPKKTVAFGLEGLEPHLAEILFVDPNITAEEADRVSGIYRNGNDVPGLLKLLQSSFNSTIQYYRKYNNRDSDDYKELRDNIRKKIKSWTAAFGAPALFELLKINEYLNIPLSEITDKVCKSPAGLREVLNHYVIGQDDYTTALSLSFFIHRLKNGGEENAYASDLPKNTLLCAGASGTGKSLALQVLERLFETPVETVHCNTLVSEGIIGSVLSDALTNAYLKSGHELSKVGQIIIHLDEFDKLFNEGGYYNARIVNELLNLIDDNSTVSFKDSFDRNPSTLRVSSKNIMFVISGVFSGLTGIVDGRLNSGANAIGFNARRNASHTNDELYRLATQEDYITYGIKPEIMGRMSSLTSMRDMSVDTLREILLNPVNSPLSPFRNYFYLQGIQVEMTEDAANQIAQHVAEHGLGARGLRQVLQSLLQPAMFSLKVPRKKLVIDMNFLKTKF